ncbi:MAG: 50S ribosomal protein L4 [Firmicutes bacterium]|nr:50S ribosomal protein L4 [Bacillota bacterium]
MYTDVLNMQGESVKKVLLPNNIFGLEPNMSVLHEYIVTFLNNQRRGSKSNLTRAEVRGGGRKPWRQKGTGRARQGSIRSPQWRHGGVTFASKPRVFYNKLNKKVRRLAFRSALSYKVIKEELLVLENISLDCYKTKKIRDMLKLIGVSKGLIVLSSVDDFVVKSARNIPNIKTSQVENLNAYNIFYSGKIVISFDALEKIKEVFSKW